MPEARVVITTAPGEECQVDYGDGPMVRDKATGSYRFLRRYLERRPAAPLTLRQVDPLIRQLSLYRDLITQKTGDPT